MHGLGIWGWPWDFWCGTQGACISHIIGAKSMLFARLAWVWLVNGVISVRRHTAHKKMSVRFLVIQIPMLKGSKYRIRGGVDPDAVKTPPSLTIQRCPRTASQPEPPRTSKGAVQNHFPLEWFGPWGKEGDSRLGMAGSIGWECSEPEDSSCRGSRKIGCECMNHYDLLFENLLQI